MGYRIRRTDANQIKIVERFRGLGVAVAVTSSLGNGFPDLVCALVGARKVFLVEVKDGKRPPSQRKLTDDEQRFFDEWNGCVHIVSSLDQVDELVKELRRC